MHINIDINIKASEDITNSLLTLAAVLHNAVPIFNVNPKAIELKDERPMKNQEVLAPNEKVETSRPEVKEITLQEVRGTLARLSKNGNQEEVKALIKRFGATKLTEIPKEKYGELLSEANSIN
ncbi:rRNA biogenesis protein rrp5 [Clostridium tagluense]|uniref:rRNA biogenesis protein rrp5 n=1 Tax=Clostridium tagluense TaxID=360422 RepID=UPI001CF4B525|nr:rRNA biogenesis protein rrp5 [Clostridium tagluense]MCB2312104.1 rRNA biogenesis protein rrp5 [Clostridium tagluense]MCB2316711.1 rRNA biogenesis protein rrp5 [Clostridium tagluense]MCB2321549.1 rRNA biogenesis protein rrp5 [Clostridium tagluense]MCB2326580.1 rRNA biogenesis protein rrp5 [Clostridium tagluense]MCB2331303.1 rRNA biogenesis protein rrp5 [Clostridium tagluense]